MFAISFAMAICSKIYVLYFRSVGKDAYHPVEEWCKDTLALMYARYTIGFSFNYTAAVNKYIPRWNKDVFK
jgi:hypothetical protein